MKLEYLSGGSTECPLIRLCEFNRSEAQQLRQLVKSLVTGDHEHVALQNEMWVESVSGCSLDLRVGTRDDGVRQVQPLRFECVLSTEGWRGVEELLEPFSQPDSSGFQSLTTGAARLFSSLRMVNGESPTNSTEIVWGWRVLYAVCTQARPSH